MIIVQVVIEKYALCGSYLTRELKWQTVSQLQYWSWAFADVD